MPEHVVNMLRLFKPGDVLYVYCNGFFGRDSYHRKICVAVRPKYALFENEDGTAEILNQRDGLTEERVAEWKQPPGYGEE